MGKRIVLMVLILTVCISGCVNNNEFQVGSSNFTLSSDYSGYVLNDSYNTSTGSYIKLKKSNDLSASLIITEFYNEDMMNSEIDSRFTSDELNQKGYTFTTKTIGNETVKMYTRTSLTDTNYLDKFFYFKTNGKAYKIMFMVKKDNKTFMNELNELSYDIISSLN